MGALTAFTYNPWYAGRTEIPAVPGLGPSVDMTAPDFEYIIEVMLASEALRGYTHLAGALNTMVHWCKENLSKQDWYDFGLRAVKHVTKTCGKFKREFPEMCDAAIVAKSLWLVFGARCIPADTGLLEKKLCEVFGEDGEGQNRAVYLEGLSKEVKRSVERVSVEDGMRARLAQFLEVLQMRHGMGVLTEAPREAVQALSLLAAEEGVGMMYLGHQKGAPLQSKGAEPAEGVMTPAELY